MPWPSLSVYSPDSTVYILAVTSHFLHHGFYKSTPAHPCVALEMFTSSSSSNCGPARSPVCIMIFKAIAPTYCHFLIHHLGLPSLVTIDQDQTSAWYLGFCDFELLTFSILELQAGVQGDTDVAAAVLIGEKTGRVGDYIVCLFLLCLSTQLQDLTQASDYMLE